MGTTYSVLISHVGPLSSKSCTVTAANGKLCTDYFTGPLTCPVVDSLSSYTSVSYPSPWEGPPELPWGPLGGH